MGYVPTHGPDCIKVHSHLTGCPSCKLPVVYFECSCGSKIFLVPGNSGETHDCRLAALMARPSRINRRTGAINSVSQCPICLKPVKAIHYMAHVRKCSSG